jgi:tRNA pseudouridine65 synthase
MTISAVPETSFLEVLSLFPEFDVQDHFEK